jgi:hypothetical protein
VLANLKLIPDITFQVYFIQFIPKTSTLYNLTGRNMFSGLYLSFKSSFSIIINYISVVHLTRNGINVKMQDLKLKTKHNLQLY